MKATPKIDVILNDEARLAIESSDMSDWQKQQALEDLVNEGETVVNVIDYELVAADIRKLQVKSAVPFLAGVIIAGLMILPDNIQPAIYNIKQHNMNLDNFEVLCVFFARNDKLRSDFLEQTAEHAEQGVFPDEPDQQGWCKREFDVAISLLRLTLKS